jgi:hypothetical protein
MLPAGAFIATFHRAAHARDGAFAGERRVVGGDEGGRVPKRKAHPVPSGGSAFEADAADGFRRKRFRRSSGGRRARLSSVQIRFASLVLEWITRLHTAVPIATFRGAAPARCGADGRARHFRLLGSSTRQGGSGRGHGSARSGCAGLSRLPFQLFAGSRGIRAQVHAPVMVERDVGQMRCGHGARAHLDRRVRLFARLQAI